jgi:hypothetical protein
MMRRSKNRLELEGVEDTLDLYVSLEGRCFTVEKTV